ncbi:11622_t:CDS:2 [Gigaspora margarita]|uniref:11622_t:CDS:1 n=1 Tax=Gigaspora margarita TaxID=4874 RepID=A0ABM8VZT6_GIGMA|nr:11622_t:CDS:2 [Gigaspora margarita]
MEGSLDSIWEALEKGILEIVMKHILKKKICKTRVVRDSKKRPSLDKLIVELGRWVRKGKRKIGSDMTEEDRKDFGLFRENIEKRYRGLEQMVKILFNKNSDKIEKEKLKQIEWYIERRYQMIDREQGRIIKSLLKKPFNHAVVDKLLENQNNTRFRRRCFDSDALGEEWAQVYAPLERVQEK